jgi:hypothetical protein
MSRKKAHMPVQNILCGSESKVNTKCLILLTTDKAELKLELKYFSLVHMSTGFVRLEHRPDLDTVKLFVRYFILFAKSH